MDDYRSWTKVDWINPRLVENSVGQNVVRRKPCDQNELDYHPLHR